MNTLNDSEENDKIIYSINVEDIQNVAEQELGRTLNKTEIQFVENKVCDYIDWYGSISLVLNELG